MDAMVVSAIASTRSDAKARGRPLNLPQATNCCMASVQVSDWMIRAHALQAAIQLTCLRRMERVLSLGPSRAAMSHRQVITTWQQKAASVLLHPAQQSERRSYLIRVTDRQLKLGMRSRPEARMNSTQQTIRAIVSACAEMQRHREHWCRRLAAIPVRMNNGL